MLVANRRAHAAAKYVQQGDLRGVSVGVHTRRSDWMHLTPAEWEPRTGDLDLERRQAVELDEISLTPLPAQRQHAQVRHIFFT